jgi:hypothetical protein
VRLFAANAAANYNPVIAAQAAQRAPEIVDDCVAVPNRDPVGSSLLRRDLRLWLVARHQALALLHQRRPMHNLRCRGSRRHRALTTSRARPIPLHTRSLPTWRTLRRLKLTRGHHLDEEPSACDSPLILVGKPRGLRSIPGVALIPELPNKRLGNRPSAPIGPA